MACLSKRQFCGLFKRYVFRYKRENLKGGFQISEELFRTIFTALLPPAS